MGRERVTESAPGVWRLADRPGFPAYPHEMGALLGLVNVLERERDEARAQRELLHAYVTRHVFHFCLDHTGPQDWLHLSAPLVGLARCVQGMSREQIETTKGEMRADALRALANRPQSQEDHPHEN